MKILHCCLAAFYIDDYSYQENILPKFHKLQGHDVKIIASTETYVNKTNLGYIQPSSYQTKEGIPITRIPYLNWIPFPVVKKIRIYKNLFKEIDQFKPDLIFLHDCQFLSILSIRKYLKTRNIPLFIDCHTDFINSGRNFISKNILHQMIYRFCAKSIEKYTTKFYGTLPVREEFLRDVYKIDEQKISLLPFGLDDSLIDLSQKDNIRNRIRSNYHLNDSDIVFITGGKIDRRKNIHFILEAFQKFQNQHPTNNFKLIVFGKPDSEMETTILPLLNHSAIIYAEWLNPLQITEHFIASDISLFLGTHSVLWEETLGLGIPSVFKKWRNMEYLNFANNCLFLEEISTDSILKQFSIFAKDTTIIEELKINALTPLHENFYYSKISKEAINLNK